jgi:hypothetical protein
MSDMPDGSETDMNMLLSMLDQNNAEALTQAQLLDNNLLNGLPPTFDFDAWSEYFGRFDFPQNGNSNFNNGSVFSGNGQGFQYTS